MNFSPAPFRSWLINRNYSASTQKNYIADITNFFNYVSLSNSQLIKIEDIFSQDIILSYISTLTNKTNYKRYLASLNKFCQFALDQKIISTNPLKKIQYGHSNKYVANNQTNPKHITDQFAIYLKQQHKSNSTIKNYLVDVNQFLTWSNHEL